MSLTPHADDTEWMTFRTGTARIRDWITKLEAFSAEHQADFRTLLARQVLDAEERIKELSEAVEHMRNQVVKQAAELRALKTASSD